MADDATGNERLRQALEEIAKRPYWEGCRMIEIAEKALSEPANAVPVPPIDVSKVMF